jgi:hypothetical protein
MIAKFIKIGREGECGSVLIGALHNLQFGSAFYAELAWEPEIAEARKAALRDWKFAIRAAKATHKNAGGSGERDYNDQISQVL